SVHNDMHMRWSGVLRDPETNVPVPAGHRASDFAEKWNTPKFDDLADFYSSHVNPIFYKLHGWIDNRIEDWFSAHEQAAPGSVKRRVVDGVQWFEKGKWVQLDAPWIGPAGHQHHGGGSSNAVETMKNVILLLDPPSTVLTLASAETAGGK